MKVLFDSTVLVLAFLENIAMNQTGIYRYTENLATQLHNLDTIELTFYSMLDKRERKLWEREMSEQDQFKGIGLKNYFHPLKAKMDVLKQRMMDAPKIKRLFLKSLRESYRTLMNSSMHLAGSRENIDIFYSPYHPIPKRFKETKNIHCFTMVHDLIPLKYPKFFKVNKQGFFNNILKKPRSTDFFIAPSKSTKADICHYYSVDPSKIFVVQGAVQKDLFYPVKDAKMKASILKKYHIEKPYLLSLATLEPRKNILTLINAYIQMIEENPFIEHQLVLAGAKGWGLESLKQKIEPYKDHILLTGFIKDKDLAALYSGATAFVYPSLYEGFGFPPLEAMHCETPVIVSDRSSLPEVVQGAGLYVDPTNVDDISAQMLKVIENTSLRQELKELSYQQISKFSWERAATETQAAFQASLSQIS